MDNQQWKLVRQPVFFERNRVFRVYTGGKLFHDFFGDEAADSNKPEEWIASDVRALNSVQESPNTGISRIRGIDLYFDQLLREQKKAMLGDRDSLGILVKILDSAIRLPIQVHPDKAFSRRYFHSSYGKAESWVILATRENACLYFGFADKLTPEAFAEACERSETEPDILEGLLNKLPVQPGDVFFIPARMVHAIGYGCLILEVQEPTDFTIQPEAWCGDYKLNDYEKYLGLDPAAAIRCFDFSLYGPAAAALAKKDPIVLSQKNGVTLRQCIGPQDTDCFGVRSYRLENGRSEGLYGPAVYIVTDGNGKLIMDGYEQPVAKGDYFFLPACISGQCRAEGTLEMFQCLPSDAAV